MALVIDINIFRENETTFNGSLAFLNTLIPPKMNYVIMSYLLLLCSAVLIIVLFNVTLQLHLAVAARDFFFRGRTMQSGMVRNFKMHRVILCASCVLSKWVPAADAPKGFMIKECLPDTRIIRVYC